MPKVLSNLNSGFTTLEKYKMILCAECQIRKSHISKKELSDDIFLSSIHAHVNLLTFFNLEDSIFVKASTKQRF